MRECNTQGRKMWALVVFGVAIVLGAVGFPRLLDLGHHPRQSAELCGKVVDVSDMTTAELYASALRCLAARLETLPLAREEEQAIGEAVQLLWLRWRSRQQRAGRGP